MNISDELDRIYDMLQSCYEQIELAEPAEKNTFFRLSVTLLDKIVSLKERSAKIDQVIEFQNTIIEIMENVLSTEERTQIIDRLRSYCHD